MLGAILMPLPATVGIVPPILLLAAVLAAEGVRYVLVGSAGLYLRGCHSGPPGDIDAVPAPDTANLLRLHEVLADLALGGRCPPAPRLTTADLVQVQTGFGRLDCLLARGRQDYAKLHANAEAFEVYGVPVLTAPASELRAFRARYKDVDGE
jgi:hypothetical protein